MKLILESLQHYDHLWREKERQDEDVDYLCGYCLEEKVESETEICPKCQESLRNLDGG